MNKTSRSLQSIVPFLALSCLFPCLLAHAAANLTTYLPLGSQPQWTADGKWILYVDESGNLAKIPEGGGPAVSLGPTEVSRPTSSPDGNWIAYTTWNEIRRIPASGGASTTLGSNLMTDLRWSPDSNWILCCNGNYEIQKLPAAGGSPVIITTDVYPISSPAWSPDGNSIVYLRTVSAIGQICTIPSSGGTRTDLTACTHSHAYPFWSPDGNWIAYLRDASYLYKIPSAGGDEVLLTSSTVGPPQWYPDGNWILCSSSAGMCRVPSSGGSPVTLSTTLSGASLSPDGAQIVGCADSIAKAPAFELPSPSWGTPGWARIHSDYPDWRVGIPLAGSVLYGDKIGKDMAGVSASTQASLTHILPHFDLSKRWYTAIAVANPSWGLQANVTATAYKDSGELLGTASFTVPAKGKVSKLLTDSTLFGTIEEKGWLELTSDVCVTAMLLYGDKISGGTAALSSVEPAKTMYLPHFKRDNTWWTGIAVVNPSANSRSVTLTAYDSSGLQVSQVSKVLAGHEKLTGNVENIFTNLPLSISGSVKIDGLNASDTVAPMAVFGIKSTSQIAAVAGMVPSCPLHFSVFFSDDKWWTGIVLLNVAGGSVSYKIHVSSEDGSEGGSKTVTLSHRQKSVNLVSQIADLVGQNHGWIHIESPSDPGPYAVAMEMICANDSVNQAYGLAALEQQEQSSTLYLPHYAVDSRWWTTFGIANCNSPVFIPDAHLSITGWTNPGQLSGSSEPIMPSYASMAQSVKFIFGVL